MGRGGGALVLAVVAALAACVGAPEPVLSTMPTGSPPPAIPDFGGAGPPERGDCFTDIARVPPRIPIPPEVDVQGPHPYAAPFEPIGVPPRRISGNGFAYEVSSRVGLVAGFYATCLQYFALERNWQRIESDTGGVIFRIRLANRERPAFVIIEDAPGGPTLVVVFPDPVIVPAPSPEPSAGPSPTATSPGATPTV